MGDVLQFKPKEKVRKVKIKSCGCGCEEFYISVELRVLCSQCRKYIKDYVVCKIEGAEESDL